MSDSLPLLVNDNIVEIARHLMKPLQTITMEYEHIDPTVTACCRVFRRLSKEFSALFQRDIPTAYTLPWASLHYYQMYHLACASHRLLGGSSEHRYGGWQRLVLSYFEEKWISIGNQVELPMYRRYGYTTLMVDLVTELMKATDRIPLYIISYVTRQTNRIVEALKSEASYDTSNKVIILDVDDLYHEMDPDNWQTKVISHSDRGDEATVVYKHFYKHLSPIRGIAFHDNTYTWWTRSWVPKGVETKKLISIGAVGVPDRKTIIFKPNGAPDIKTIG